MKLVNHCDEHRVYAAGCERCKAQSRAYRANHTPRRRQRDTAYAPPEVWRRMTEIGRRLEGDLNEASPPST